MIKRIILLFLVCPLIVKPAFCMAGAGRLIFGIGSLTAAGAFYAASVSSSKDNKYAKYAVPTDIKRVLDAHQQDIVDTFNKKGYRDNVHAFPWLPNYVIKRTVPGRLEGHEFCQMIIRQNPTTMSLLEVPAKYYYADSSKHKYVLAEKVEGVVSPASHGQPKEPSKLDTIKSWFGLMKHEHIEQLTLEQTQQLCAFIVQSGWWDAYRDNFALRTNGRISIIDTQLQCFDKERVVDGLRVLTEPGQQKYYCSECKVYVQDLINRML
jgi:hypothetical protein